MGFRSGDWDGHGISLILCSVNHLCVDLDNFGSLPCWKIQQWPNFCLIAGAAIIRLKMSWYFMEFMMPCTLTRFPGPLEEKQPHNITDPPPYLTVGITDFRNWILGWLGVLRKSTSDFSYKLKQIKNLTHLRCLSLNGRCLGCNTIQETTIWSMVGLLKVGIQQLLVHT